MALSKTAAFALFIAACLISVAVEAREVYEEVAISPSLAPAPMDAGGAGSSIRISGSLVTCSLFFSVIGLLSRYN